MYLFDDRGDLFDAKFIEVELAPKSRDLLAEPISNELRKDEWDEHSFRTKQKVESFVGEIE